MISHRHGMTGSAASPHLSHQAEIGGALKRQVRHHPPSRAGTLHSKLLHNDQQIAIVISPCWFRKDICSAREAKNARLHQIICFFRSQAVRAEQQVTPRLQSLRVSHILSEQSSVWILLSNNAPLLWQQSGYSED